MVPAFSPLAKASGNSAKAVAIQLKPVATQRYRLAPLHQLPPALAGEHKACNIHGL